MLQGLQNAASSLQATARNHEVVATNLANASVSGYRRRVMPLETFEQAMAQAAPLGGQSSGRGTQAAGVSVVFEAGDNRQTGRSLDVAIQGDGFFVLESPSGPLYTRNGSFEIGPDGELRGVSGLPVLTDAGKINITSGVESLKIREDGTIQSLDAPIGKLRVARFSDPTALVPVTATLFAASPNDSPSDSDATVHQGMLESSNVNVVFELVRMIEGMRHYEASQRVLRAISDAIELSTRPE